MRNKITCLVLLFAFVSCQKEEHRKIIPMNRVDFFSDTSDMYGKVQKAINQYVTGEKLEQIESISYIDSKNKSYAFVFYRTSKGSSNIVIQRKPTDAVGFLSGTAKCDGAGCECKVKTVIHNNGDVDLDCTCSSCTLLIN